MTHPHKRKGRKHVKRPQKARQLVWKMTVSPETPDAHSQALNRGVRSLLAALGANPDWLPRSFLASLVGGLPLPQQMLGNLHGLIQHEGKLVDRILAARTGEGLQALCTFEDGASPSEEAVARITYAAMRFVSDAAGFAQGWLRPLPLDKSTPTDEELEGCPALVAMADARDVDVFLHVLGHLRRWPLYEWTDLIDSDRLDDVSWSEFALWEFDLALDPRYDLLSPVAPPLYQTVSAALALAGPMGIELRLQNETPGMPLEMHIAIPQLGLGRVMEPLEADADDTARQTALRRLWAQTLAFLYRLTVADDAPPKPEPN